MHNHSENNSRMSGVHLAPLGQLDNCRIADGEPDIRGWNVHTLDGCTAGKVDDLIVDTDARKVRYMDVKLDRKELGLSEDRHVLVPLDDARLDPRSDDVLLESTTREQLSRMQAMDRDTLASMQSTRRDSSRMTLSEEQLRVGKHVTESGAVDVHKTVRSQRMEKDVPVMHEEVEVERRPLSAESSTRATIREDEIHVPLRSEEAFVEKRTVPREEVVIRKKLVAGEQHVEADLRHEQVDVDRNVQRGDARKQRKH